MKKITIYKDFEAQKNQEIEDVLKISPKERIMQMVTLIKKNLSPPAKPEKTKKIIFQLFSSLD